MAVHVQCPTCGKNYSIADKLQGKKVRCQCGGEFVVPSAGVSPAPLPMPSFAASDDPLGLGSAAAAPSATPAGAAPWGSSFTSSPKKPKKSEINWERHAATAGKAVGGCLALVVVIGLLITFVAYATREWREARKRSDELKQRWSAHGGAVEGYLKLADAEYKKESFVRTGRFVIVDVPSKQIDFEIMGALPPGLAANAPEEVEGVVLLDDWQQPLVGSYSDGRPAYAQECRVRIVSPTGPSLISMNVVQGPNPADKIRKNSNDGSNIGDRPVDGIASMLVALAEVIKDSKPSGSPPVEEYDDELNAFYASWSEAVQRRDFPTALGMMEPEPIADYFDEVVGRYCKKTANLSPELQAVYETHFPPDFCERFMACKCKLERLQLIKETHDPATLMTELNEGGNPGLGFMAVGVHFDSFGRPFDDREGRRCVVGANKRPTVNNQYHDFQITFAKNADTWVITKVLVFHNSYDKFMSKWSRYPIVQ